ncbi:NAD(P)/FAD-dependent oxidoreductase [Paenibacillus methanolicus]|uniref:Sarcosine oxidase subunit alpha n=1 Tax=Paenibacillus methanolicus TaxID=582686 RepID=A0A5S5CJZ8_9BACL|nr:FAD-dependent oxidoreductase [Paenibacillus methanolicus]TYP78911.1 sarcosine oxidase subunit alpha [Paenibacillus methanolicus]
MTSKGEETDLIIVGAGPAGLSAANKAAEYGLRVTVIDEFPEPGGRMLGQFHEESGHWWVGKQIADELIAEAGRRGVRIRCGVSVYGMLKVDDRFEVSTSIGALFAPRVLLATGAAEIPMPVQGWTLPGVMSIGAAQVMANVNFVKPGRRGLIVGINVLAMAIARELSVSGVSLAGIVLPPAGPLAGAAAKPKDNLELLMGLSHLAPSPILRMGSRIARSCNLAGWIANFFPRKGIRMWDIPLQLRTAAVSINGNERVESVTLAQVDAKGEILDGSQWEEPVDFVALAGGLYPLAELASVAGCPFIYTPELGGHLPLHSEQMRTPVEGLYVAGNITGVESALVAMSQGRLAAASIGVDADAIGSGGDRIVAEAMEEVGRTRAAALIQFQPGIAEARRGIYRLWQETIEVGV